MQSGARVELRSQSDLKQPSQRRPKLLRSKGWLVHVVGGRSSSSESVVLGISADAVLAPMAPSRAPWALRRDSAFSFDTAGASRSSRRAPTLGLHARSRSSARSSPAAPLPYWKPLRCRLLCTLAWLLCTAWCGAGEGGDSRWWWTEVACAGTNATWSPGV